MAHPERSYEWRRQGVFLENSYASAPRYQMSSIDTDTRYPGYQQDSARDVTTRFPEQSARSYPVFRPSTRPPVPLSPYYRNEPDASFAARRQRQQYINLSQNESHQEVTRPRYEPAQTSVDDVEACSIEHGNSGNVHTVHPSDSQVASIRETIDDPIPEAAQDFDKSLLVSASVRRADTSPMPNPSLHISKADLILNRVYAALRLKQVFHWAGPRYFHEKAWFSTDPPHSYQPPLDHLRISNESYVARHKHLDVFRRTYEGVEADQYLDPLNGRVRKLFVQTIDRIYDTDNDTTWRRTYVKNISPRLLRLAWWSRAGFLVGKKEHVAKQNTAWKDIRARTTGLSADQWTQLGLRWIPSCIGLLILMCFPSDVEGQVRNHGCYDPVPYRFWSYPKIARNYFENKDAQLHVKFSHAIDFRISERSLSPRYLCFLDSRMEQNPRGRLDPQEWVDKHHGNAQASYIFISYTGEKQFERLCRVAGTELEATGSSSCKCDQCERSRADADVLHGIARLAAQTAQVPAYWTDQCCMSTDREEFSKDIYGICDVVRGAKKIVIVVGRSGTDQLPANVTTLDLLREWGTRMWTWPEILLAQPGKKITVYTRGAPQESQPVEMSKLSFTKQVFTDAPIARYLVDHFEGTLVLSPLELVVLALECLTDRVINGTTPFADGDLSYALMGILRQRPTTDKQDTAFQAFARLSLANDSNQLLERMICLLPVPHEGKSTPVTNEQDASLQAADRMKAAEQAEIRAKQTKKHYWTNLNDHWGAKLWDVEPQCQVAGIAAWDTVILDGAHGATVHWDSFQRVAITTRETWSRMLGRSSVRATPMWFFIAVLILATSGGDPTTTGIGVIFLILSLVLILLSPILVLHIYSGKVWNSQPWLFGFEGHMSLEQIEKRIFGFPCDRLSWTPYSSVMSRHQVNDSFIEDECQGRDPCEAGYAPPRFQSGGASSRRNDGTRLFTLVDTLTMTVSTFYAERPPAIALLCGSEGGMQRAVMCSYDWTTQTLYRETVLRMETRILERMPRIGRVRFGLKRGEGKA